MLSIYRKSDILLNQCMSENQDWGKCFYKFTYLLPCATIDGDFVS